MTCARLTLITVALMCMSLASSADALSPLVGHSFPIYYRALNEAGISEVHRSVLVFSQQGATSDVFPSGAPIPFTGTLTMQRVGRKGSTIGAFNAQGTAPAGKGTITFTASKDGSGAKGQVTISAPGKETITVAFQGSRLPS